MEEQEFRERVIPLQRLMYGMALKVGLPPEDAADIVQEAQLRLWRGREGIPRPDEQLRAYCLKTLRNECLTFLKRRKETVSIESEGEALSKENIDLRDHAEERDTQAHIEKLIDTLPAGQKIVIRLSSFGGMDIEEISEATGYTAGNVRQLLSRGRKRLRELIR
ncbi:MAG: sigma-70 family RNA polymerase sigma factor [Muribaculaceae bacterium]|nr:sigma-70 family RNA polymerase sigma factor [Muribaculaceae bacterium]